MNIRLPIVELHQEIDRETKRLEEAHGARLKCKLGCADCCLDDLTVFEAEADRIRATYPELLAEGTPHPPGRCAFLGDGDVCRIYEARPYVCRTQGLPLRWIDETEDGELAEFRDICPLNEAGPPIETLEEEQCWSIGPFEARLAGLASGSSKEARRVSLRSLFSAKL